MGVFSCDSPPQKLTGADTPPHNLVSSSQSTPPPKKNKVGTCTFIINKHTEKLFMTELILWTVFSGQRSHTVWPSGSHCAVRLGVTFHLWTLIELHLFYAPPKFSRSYFSGSCHRTSAKSCKKQQGIPQRSASCWFNTESDIFFFVNFN